MIELCFEIGSHINYDLLETVIFDYEFVETTWRGLNIFVSFSVEMNFDTRVKDTYRKKKKRWKTLL